MRPLILGPDEQRLIQKIIDHAEQHPLDLATLRAIMAGRQLPPGDRLGRVGEIPFGYRVCYSIEQQPRGWMRHLSVSVDAPGKWPQPIAVERLMTAFGFRCAQLDDPEVAIYQEDAVEAVNVLEPLHPPEVH